MILRGIDVYRRGRLHKRLAISLSVGAVLLASVGISAAGGVDICLRGTDACPERLLPTLGATVSPRKLPVAEYAPVEWRFSGKFATGEAHPPALREMELDVDKDVRLNVDGYPSCGIKKVRQVSNASVMAACGNALLGKGEAHLEIAQTEGSPSMPPGHLLIFNAGEKGAVTKILARASFPGEVAISTISVTKHAEGIHSVTQIPRIADGMGSLTDFTFTMGATHRSGVEKVGYFEAKCPDGVFKANVKKVLFKNEANTPGEASSTTLKGSLAVPCTPSR
jgi:hypothetical protein